MPITHDSGVKNSGTGKHPSGELNDLIRVNAIYAICFHIDLKLCFLEASVHIQGVALLCNTIPGSKWLLALTRDQVLYSRELARYIP